MLSMCLAYAKHMLRPSNVLCLAYAYSIFFVKQKADEQYFFRVLCCSEADCNKKEDNRHLLLFGAGQNSK